MNRFRLFFVLLCWCAISMQAQLCPFTRILDKYSVIDTCRYKVYYEFRMAPTTDENGIAHDVHLLEIGEKCTRCHSYLLYQGDSLYTECEKQGLSSRSLNQYVWPVETRMDFDKQETTFLFRPFLHDMVLKYTEPTERIDWQILTETDSVAGYLCQLAVCQFRGRDYRAWFSAELPFNVGPYKFYGLPGLILKMEDSE